MLIYRIIICKLPKEKRIYKYLYSLGALIGSSYSILGEKIIDHNREKEPYYREEIAKRSRNYFLFGMILLPIVTAFSLILFF